MRKSSWMVLIPVAISFLLMIAGMIIFMSNSEVGVFLYVMSVVFAFIAFLIGEFWVRPMLNKERKEFDEMLKQNHENLLTKWNELYSEIKERNQEMNADREKLEAEYRERREKMIKSNRTSTNTED